MGRNERIVYGQKRKGEEREATKEGEEGGGSRERLEEKREREQAKGKNSTLGKGNKGERGKTEEREGTMGGRIVHEGEG